MGSVGIIIVLATISGLTVLSFLWPSSASLRWGIEVGNEFTYRIVIQGYRTVEDPTNHSNYIRNSSYYASLNNTIIRATITSMPALGIWYDSSGFVRDIINQPKVNCTFDNGTTMQDDFRNLTDTLLSRCILPIGDWAFLDSLFPDFATYAFYPGVYLSKAGPDFFSISYRIWYVDGSYSWSGNASLALGVPIVAQQITDTPSTGAYSLFRLIMV